MIFSPAFFGLFLVGLLAGRMRIITEAAAHTGLLKKILVVGGAVGLIGNFFGAQVLFSVIWLKHFRFGPAEWVWRSITYGKRQPMRLVR